MAEADAKKLKGPVPSMRLSSGFSMPMVGLGTWKSTKPGEARDAVEAAIDAGYRHIDCALVYGNEVEVGQALKKKMDGGIKREDLFIVGKLFNNSHKRECVQPACEKSLADLGLQYLDLYLIHWPHAFQSGGACLPKRDDGTVIYDEETHFTETWSAMEKLVAAGLVKSIGISNFNASQVKEITRTCKIKPAMNQVERHPYFDQARLLNACLEEGIPLTAYCPLGSGDNPCRKEGDPKLLEDEVLVQIGKKYGKSAAQVAIRWQIDCGVAVVPKSSNPGRIVQNFDVCDFQLTSEDRDAIAAINRDWRCNEPTITIDGVAKPRDASHKLYPFNEPF